MTLAVYASTTCGPCCSVCSPRPQRLYETFESLDQYLRSTLAILEKVHKKTLEKLRFRASDIFDQDWMPKGKFLEDLEQSRYITEGEVFPQQVLRVDRVLTDDSWLDRHYSELDKDDENLALVEMAVHEIHDEICSPYDVETYIKEDCSEWPVQNTDAGQRLQTYWDVLDQVNSDTIDLWLQCKKTIDDAVRGYDELVTYILEQCQPSKEIVKRIQWYKSRNLTVDDACTLDRIRTNKELHQELGDRIEAVFRM